MRPSALSMVLVLGLVGGGFATPAVAAPCKDAKGKFVKCPEAKPGAAARCKNAKGHFAKCGTPGAKPV